MPRIRSQGAMGSCVAFAFCAAKEWQEYAQRGFTDMYLLSPKFLYSFVQIFPGGGSMPRDALKIMQKVGIPLEMQAPYGRNNSDKYQFEPPIKNRASLKIFNTARRFRIGGYARVSTVGEAIHALATVGPFQIGIEWLEGWYDATKLNVNAGQISGGHAVCVCGYSRRDRHFIIHNSWGNSWGEKGYGYLSFNAFEKHARDNWVFFDHQNSMLV